MKILSQIDRKYKLRYRRFLVLYLVLAAGLVVSSILVTQTTGELSRAAVSAETGQLVRILLWMALFTAVNMVFDALGTCLSGRVNAKSGYAMRKDFASFLTRIPFKSISKKSSGTILSLYSNDLPQALALLTTDLLLTLTSILQLVAGAAFMFFIHPLYSLIFFLLFPPLAWMQAKIAKPIQPLVQQREEYRGKFNGVVNDSLQNTSIVLAYGLQEEMEQRYLASYDEYYQVEQRRVAVFLKLVTSGILATMLPLIFVHVAGAIAVVQGQIDIGQFVVFTSLASNAGNGLSMLSQRLGQIQTQKAGGARLLENIQEEAPPALPEATAGKAAEGLALELENVSFSYDGKTDALTGISLRVSTGGRVAFVGKSGCGKSTLAKLLLGLYAPDGGRLLRAEGNAAAGVAPTVAYVPQDSFIFPDTIRQNITCEQHAPPDEERLLAAAQAAGIHNFIASLPAGYDTVLQPGGENLSGGQRQRIAIARALYRNAPVLLLDEATSALDAATESAVLAEIDKACAGKTILTVAHRVAAVKDSDCIYLMEDGHIVESGTYAELSRPGTKYHALYESQQEEEERHG